jgi:methylornithine synthase
LIDPVDSILKATGFPIMVSPGVIPEHVLGRLSKAGASGYACYQEIHQRKLFNQLRPGLPPIAQNVHGNRLQKQPRRPMA